MRVRRPWVAAPAVFALTVATAAGQDMRLVTAAAGQNTLAIQTLLAEGVDVNTRRADGATALLWATMRT